MSRNTDILECPLGADGIYMTLIYSIPPPMSDIACAYIANKNTMITRQHTTVQNSDLRVNTDRGDNQQPNKVLSQGMLDGWVSQQKVAKQ